jgi:fatty acid desaturase
LWLGIPSWWLGAFDAAVVYGAVSTVFSLLLMALFAPNHIGMTSVRPDTRPRSLAQRLAVSRNIANPPWLDFLFGGLNAHIEHHLFPGIVAPRLRAARGITRELCREHGLAYHEATLLAAHRDVLGFLMRMARVDERTKAHDGG